MYNAIDSSGVDRGPIRDNHQLAAAYFVIYMTVVTFCLLNLLVGFIIVAFQNVGMKSFKVADLDRNQVRNCHSNPAHMFLTVPSLSL